MTVNLEKSAEATDLGSAFGVGYTIPRVNLLPPEFAEQRRLRRTQAILALAVVGVLGALAGGFVLAQASASNAQDELAAEQARTVELQAEAAQYEEVPRVLAQVDAAQTARSTAMASDVLWHRYLDDLALTYPENVWLGTMTVTVADTAVTATAPVAGAPGSDPLATPGIGTIAFTGTGLVHSDVSAWLDVLAGTTGFADPTFTQADRGEIDGKPVVGFTSQVVVTEEALSGRYEREAN